MLTRDGDSTYYINNIPVRRRDIHDLFLGTGLGPARVRDHRAGNDLARHRGEARGAAHLPRGGCRRVEVQGAAPRNRRPARRHARESLARRGHPAGARQPARRGSRSRRRSPRSTASSRIGIGRRSTCCGTRRRRTRCARASAMRARSRPSPSRSRRLQADVRQAETRLVTLRDQHFAAGRRAARQAGRVLRGECRGDAARAATRVRARERDTADRAGRAAHRSARRTGGPADGTGRRAGRGRTGAGRGAGGARAYGSGGGARACGSAPAGVGRRGHASGNSPSCSSRSH